MPKLYRKFANNRWAFRLSGLIAMPFFLWACEGPLPKALRTPDEVMDTAQYVSVPTSAIWVNAPDAVAALQRGLMNADEQRVALPNRTTVPGDNVLLLLARYFPGENIGRFQYDVFVHQIEGLPEPFQDMKSGDLTSGEDELGTYFWSEKRYGDTTICVLGLRRLAGGVRQLPGNANVLDVMVRNCVNGTAEDALLPISAKNIGNYAASANPTPSGQIRMLSPLAGPTP